MIKVIKEDNGRYTVTIKKKSPTNNGYVELFAVENLKEADVATYLEECQIPKQYIEGMQAILGRTKKRTCAYFTGSGKLYYTL